MSLMLNEEIKNYIDQQIKQHNHRGFDSARLNLIDIFGTIPARIHVDSATITTTGNTDTYIIAPINGTLIEVDFSGVDALAANDTNYITFSITNLGQDGAGTTALLAATDANTTKATGGSAISANTKRSLTLNTTSGNTQVAVGDRLRIRAAATGTLANTVTFPTYMLRFI